MLYLTRRYRFCAGHRLHNEALDDDQNRRIYGKCNNPSGHGHNYLMEVTVAGPIDPATGMVYDLLALDRIVEKQVMERFDHKNLNLDVETFRRQIPTTENLCLEIFNLLRPEIERSKSDHSVRLSRVRLEETSLNSFECLAEDRSGKRRV
jgi:6-pyruvoyltetrahydropterin/6-carboxytetrahydropterin synthase